MVLPQKIQEKFCTAALPLLLGAALLLPAGSAAASADSAPAAAVQATYTARAVKVQHELEHSGFRQHGVLYIPLKDLAPMLDLQIQWNPENSSVEVTGLYQAVTLKLGQPKAYTADYKVIMLGTPPIVREGITYVPEKLFSKAFHLPVTWEGKALFSVSYTEKYIKEALGDQLFWLNKERGVVYSGTSGKLPSRAGTVNIHNLDWVGMTVRKINNSSYALEINNAFGEPHINESRYRVLLHEGKIAGQAVSSYHGTRNLGMKDNLFAFQGNIVLMNRNILTLVNPDGQPFKTYDLKQLTGVDDAFSLEAMDTEYLLVRPFQAGTLILIDRQSGKSTLLYRELLSTDDQTWLEQYPVTEFDYPGDSLVYTGRSGGMLSFEWNSFKDSRKVHFTYALFPSS